MSPVCGIGRTRLFTGMYRPEYSPKTGLEIAARQAATSASARDVARIGGLRLRLIRPTALFGSRVHAYEILDSSVADGEADLSDQRGLERAGGAVDPADRLKAMIRHRVVCRPAQNEKALLAERLLPVVVAGPLSPNSTCRTRSGAGSFRSARLRSSSARCKRR